MPFSGLVLYPASELSTPAAPVTAFDGGLADLIARLTAGLDQVPAIGLTAPHLGILLRVVAVRLAPDLPVSVYVNPRIEEASDETAVHEEGSVSMPGVTETVERPKQVRVVYQDSTGRYDAVTLEGWAAAVLQHEIDQLEGVFWIHRLSRLKRERIIKRWQKTQPRS
jgi:peptide deformylase